MDYAAHKKRIELNGRRAYAHVKKLDWRWAGLILLVFALILSLIYEFRR